MKPMTLFLMTKKGYTLLLDTVARFGHLFEEVVVARDAALDRDYFDEIVELCEKHGIQWREREKGGEVRSRYAMAVSWRWMIAHPEQRLIVFHDSLLPKYRGFNPLVSCLINGEARVGVTALLGAGRYDSGHILSQSATEIQYPITISDAIEAVLADYRSTAMDVLGRIDRGESLEGRPQDENQASYSLWRDEDDYRVPWSRPAEWIARFVDAVGAPYKQASTLIDGVLGRISAAKALPDVTIENRAPGKVIWMEGDLPVVACGEGLLQILELRDDETGASMLPLTRFRTRFG